MRSIRKAAASAAVLMSMAWIAGCQPQPAVPAPPLSTAMDQQFDACAEQLHDLCGSLLLYYVSHGNLPPTLADVTDTPSGTAAPVQCPTSHKPYVYNPKGIEIPGWPGRLILYDPEPCHANQRYGILLEPPRPGRQVVIRVVRPPAAAILSHSQPSTRPVARPAASRPSIAR